MLISKYFVTQQLSAHAEFTVNVCLIFGPNKRRTAFIQKTNILLYPYMCDDFMNMLPLKYHLVVLTRCFCVFLSAVRQVLAAAKPQSTVLFNTMEHLYQKYQHTIDFPLELLPIQLHQLFVISNPSQLQQRFFHSFTIEPLPFSKIQYEAVWKR